MTDTAAVYTNNTPILESDIEEVRAMIGQPLRLNEPRNRSATADNIRHYAIAVGDDNPLWCDEAYGLNGPFGTVVAPPTWLYTTWAAGVGPGFGGLMAFHAGGRWEIKRYVRPGDRVVAEAKLAELRDVKGRRSGRLLIEIGDVTYKTPEGELLARHESRCFRLPRRTAEGGLNYESTPPHEYSEQEIDEIDQAILSYRRRGNEPLYWESVSVGDELPRMAKGPLDTETLLAYRGGGAGGGLPRDLSVRARDFAQRHPELMPNNRPIEWAYERTNAGTSHYDAKAAQAVGMPNLFDVGYTRIGYLSQLVTDWIGDQGTLRVLDVFIRLPNVIGDTLWCTGKVTSKSIDGTDHLVHLDVWADRQDGARNCEGTATVVLPSRSS